MEEKKNEIKVQTEEFVVQGCNFSEDFILNIIRELRSNTFNSEGDKKLPAAPKVLNNVSVNPGDNFYSEDFKQTIGEKYSKASKEMYAAAGVEHKTSDTDYYHTGIKYTESGKPKYRLGYSCPKCGETGRHYIPLEVETVSCHKCQSALIVEPATSNGMGRTDKYRDHRGNYLIAEILDMGVGK